MPQGGSLAPINRRGIVVSEVRLSGQLVCSSAAEAAVVRQHLPLHLSLTVDEPGCLLFDVRQTDDPLVWQVEERFLEHWSVEQYASRLGLSTARLNRLARAESGRSALELVHERLTREACRRLVYIAAPVAGVAEELGFADPAYFSRFFKRRMGMNPHRWRQLQLGAADASAAG